MKQVPNFSNYSITEDGKVWNNRFNRWLKPDKGLSGHLRVCLCKNTKKYRLLVHRLVLETYVGKCPEGMECCHNNGNPQDNRLENLRWDTRSNNQFDSIKHGTHVNNDGEKSGNSKLKESDVRMIIYLWNIGEYLQKEIAEMYGVSRSCIENIVGRKSWRSVWKILEMESKN